MRAAVLVGPGQIELQQRPQPEPGPGEALVRVIATGICGSDLSAYHGHADLYVLPRVLGHEVGGEVVALGPATTTPNSPPAKGPDQALRVGDRVVLDHMVACGACYACRRGRPHCCPHARVIGAQVDGGLAEYFVVPTSNLYPIPPHVSDEELALVQPLAIACHAVDRGAVERGDRMVVIGAGAIGLLCQLVAGVRGASVLVADIVPERLERAAALGAARTVQNNLESLAEAVHAFTGGEGAEVVIEASGAAPMLAAAAQVAAIGGRIVVVGIGGEPALAAGAFVRKELDVRGARAGGGAFPSAIELAATEDLPLRALISHRLPLEEAMRAFDLLAHHPEQTAKIVLVP